MKSRNLLLSTLMTLLAFGLQAQANDLQSLKDNVDQIVKSKDAKDQKQDKLTKALKSYGDELTRKNPGKQGEELISQKELDEILALLRPALLEIEQEGAKGKQPKSRGAMSLGECIYYEAYVGPNRQCLVNPPYHGIPGVVIIWVNTYGPCFEHLGFGAYCISVPQ